MNNYDVRVTAFGSLNDAQIKHLYLTNKTILQFLATLLDNCCINCQKIKIDTMKVSIVSKNGVNMPIRSMYKKQKSTRDNGRSIK